MAGRPKKNIETTETKVEEVLQEVKVEQKVVEEVVQEEIKPKRLSGRMRNNNGLDLDRLDKTRKVPVVSVKSGTVGYSCKSTMQTLIWSNYGDEHTMSIEELLIMYSQNKKFLTAPWLLVDDEEFADVLNLTSIYESIFDTEDLEKFYSGQLIKIKRKLEDLPNGVRRELLNRTVMAINGGDLNNLSVVKLLKQEYNIDVEI